MRLSYRDSVPGRAPPSPSPIEEEEGFEFEFGEPICEACDPEDRLVDTPLHFCFACDFTFCENCWKSQLQHRKKSTTNSGVVHEKSNPWIARQIQNVLSPPSDESQYAKLCAQDEHTSWFGIDRGNRNDGPLMLKDSGRYAELMAQTKDDNSLRFSWNSGSDSDTTPLRDSRTPSLVSFVGQSGAGKSTLINLLITFKGGNRRDSLIAPVVGMTGKDVPTSEDVHLYPDPATVDSMSPLLFADCEGLDGGEREPVGTVYRKARPNSPNLRSYSVVSIDRPVYISERELQWATEDPNKRTRNFAVAHLYPRLLFSFSDTVVFVLKNPRVIEGVFERLIEWAAAALETSSNQPVLPSAIIALNATEINVEADLWDVESSTRSLLDSLSDTVKHNATFKKFVDFWGLRNKKIETLEQLILCYFSDIQIVRIPAAGRPALIQTQVEKLYDAIEAACNRVREVKLSLRMLLNASEMQSYLQYAFDHFARTLDEAFDFVQASVFNNPIPLDFGGNILRLALIIMDHKRAAKQKINPRAVFRELGNMVASCIMLDSVRHEIRGNAERIFPEYLEHIDTALKDFCHHHWPCEFTASVSEYLQHQQHVSAMAFHRNLHILNQRAHCVNVRSGHSKGHQSRTGIVFAAGDYQSTFTYGKYKEQFQHDIFRRLEELMKLLEERTRAGEEDVTAANSIHREETLSAFYADIFQDNATFTHSHSVCLGCLFDRPEHTLPCGHMLCSVCVRSYGEGRNDLLVDMHSCPLETDSPPMERPISIYLRPEAASSRVLSLDSGGVRAILQLEILRLLEEEWQGKLSIRCFFDLMVGSGAGGLIALGITTKGWSIKKCAFHIERIFTQAFKKRSGRGRFMKAGSKEKYDSDTLDHAIKEAFGEDEPLFGALHNRNSPMPTSHVVVTATTSTGSPVLFGSYNRRCLETLPYEFRRPDKPEQEIKLWEAARATMAAPKYFKPFNHAVTNQIYSSATTHHSNPIHLADSERRIMKKGLDCPDAPDLIVSLGTGVEEDLIIHNCVTSSASSIADSIAPSCACTATAQKSSKKERNDPRRNASPVRCQATSDEFVHDFPSSATSHLRFVRYNPPSLETLPHSDDIGSLDSLRTLLHDQIDKTEVKALAAKLFATLFYFESREDLAQQADGQWVANGMIRCRIPNDTPEMLNLGRLLRKKTTTLPQFIVQEGGRTPQVFRVTADIMADMVLSSRFAMPPVQIVLPQRFGVVDMLLFFDSNDRNSISGFPRHLAKPESKANRHRQALADIRTLRGSDKSDKASIYSRTTRPWQPPPLLQPSPLSSETTSLVHSEESALPSPIGAVSIPWRNGDMRGPLSVDRTQSPLISPSNTDEESASPPPPIARARSRSTSTPVGSMPERGYSSNPVRPDSNQNQATAQSPNFSSSTFPVQQTRNPAFSLYPREYGVLGIGPTRSNQQLRNAGPSRAGPAQLHPQDVARSVKMMSMQDRAQPVDMRIVFGDDTPRESGETVRKSEDSTNVKLKELEGIIRSKDRVEVDQLTEEVLLGQRRRGTKAPASAAF